MKWSKSFPYLVLLRMEQAFYNTLLCYGKEMNKKNKGKRIMYVNSFQKVFSPYFFSLLYYIKIYIIVYYSLLYYIILYFTKVIT